MEYPETVYHPIEDLELEKEKTAFITSYPLSYSHRTNFYYQRHKLCSAIHQAIQQGKDTFLSFNKTLFEVLCTSEVLYLKEKHPNIRVYHICFRPPIEHSSAWKEYTEFNRFCSIQSQLDGCYSFYDKHCNHNRRLRWLIEHSSLIIGYFSLQEFVSSITIKIATELQIPVINLFDDRMNTVKIGGGIPFEILPMIQNKELQKIISCNYRSQYGALIRGTVFGSSLYHHLSDQKSEILQQLSCNSISIETIRELTSELQKIEVEILRLIAKTAYQISLTISLPKELEGRKNARE